MPRIALIGPGAIGGLAATWLCQDISNRVTVCARTPFEELVVETPGGPISAQPEVLLEPGAGKPVDWVLVATKAYDSGSAADWLSGLMDENTQLAVLQNGVDHVERFSLYLPAERILPVIVDCPTERLSPEQILQRGPATMVVPQSDTGKAFCELFRNTEIDASQSGRFQTIAWRKLCINAAGVVNALTLQPARIANDQHAAYLMRCIVEEAVAVGLAEDVNLGGGLADEVVEIYRKQPGDSINSLLADRMAGRPMEIDLRNGVIVKLGKKHGIPTPYNDMAVSLLKVCN
ncbi:MAG: 2-dehydropantoate 2-reductase [Xanthomonadales bacterium]|jgi:2-dehydropantoate 2-reductase|nr:2-dehydropantoate 2-reductase [Xanthomonadales bacterium]